MLKIYKTFFANSRRQSATVVTLLLIAGMLEFIGIGTMLPLFHAVSNPGARELTQLESLCIELLNGLGIPLQIPALMVVVLMALLFKAAFTFWANVSADFGAKRVSIQVRQDLLRSVFNANWSYLITRKAGSIANSISVDADRSTTAYSTAVRFAANSIQALIYFLIALMISWQLAVLAFFVGALMFYCFSWIIRLSRIAGNLQTTTTSQLVSHVTDAVGNLKAIKSMQRQSQFLRSFGTRIDRLNQAQSRQIYLRHTRELANNTFIYCMFGLGLFIALVHLDIPFADLIVMAIVIGRGMSIWRQLQDQLQNIAVLESAYLSAHKLAADYEAAAEINSGSTPPTLKQNCEFQDVSFAYDENLVLQDVSLELPAGKLTVLQGRSGAGKTTIVDLLIGLIRPTSGRILIDGTDLSDISINDWRGMVGYVPQELTLLHSTVRDNITLGKADISDAEIIRALELAGVLDVVSELRLGLDEQVGEMGSRLSGGQRQRIALARAIVARPHLLILDEVTSALDPTTEKEICENIAGLGGMFTIVAITHRQIWSTIADRLYLVDGGRVASGTVPNSANELAEKANETSPN